MAVRISGLVSGLDTDSIVQELVSAYSKKKDDIVKKQTKLSWKQESWKEMNTKIYGFYSGALTDFKFMSNFDGMKKTTLSDASKATVTAGASVVNGTQILKINQVAKAGYMTGSKLESKNEEGYDNKTKLSELGISKTKLTLQVGGEDKTIEINGDMTIQDFTKALNEQGVSASFDAAQQRFFINSTETGEDFDFNFKISTEGQEDALGKLGLLDADYMAEKQGISKDSEAYKELEKQYAVKQDASNAIIELNGATFEGSSNTFTINGLTITAKDVTNSAMTLVTETDVDAVYNRIKSFINGYNEVISAMDKAYNADQAKGYEPLTDEEKESMGEKEIEKWEQKIKDSLLRRDSTLGSISSIMKIAMSKSYTINGKSYSLASFGINTSGYFVAEENEKGVYHIDGNADDDSSKANPDKLRSAIASDPDTVAQFFNELASDLYGELDKKMRSTTLSSAYKVYNDKQMQAEYDDYKDEIKKWEDKLKEMEEYYYNKFAAMETALSKLNSQQSQLAGLLGGS
ncbi:MAG: flagellar filament capping protein FliD [Lachnospiraceae bacterium]|nr:flagellar filament capping protein FliD [Lachnospiraceae bacterium]